MVSNRCESCRYWDTNKAIDSWGFCRNRNVIDMVIVNIPYDIKDPKLITVVYRKDYCCIYYDRAEEGVSYITFY